MAFKKIIIKNNPSSLAAPTESEISPGELAVNLKDGKLYTKLVDDGGIYQIGVEESTYTNLTPTSEAIGGIPVGQDFDGWTMTQMWNALLYPYQQPTFYSFVMQGQPTAIAVGEIITGTNRTFTWNSSNTENIVDPSIFISQDGTLLNTTALPNTPQSYGPIDLANSGANIQHDAPNSNTFRIDATNDNTPPGAVGGGNGQKFIINTQYNVWFGNFAPPYVEWAIAPVPPLDSEAITTLLTYTSPEPNVYPSSPYLNPSYTGTYHFPANAGTTTNGVFKYLCFAKPLVTAGTTPKFVDVDTGIDVAMEPPYEITVDTGYFYIANPTTPITVDYFVYRTRALQNGPLTIEVTAS